MITYCALSVCIANGSCVVVLEVSTDQSVNEINAFHLFYVWFSVREVAFQGQLSLIPWHPIQGQETDSILRNLRWCRVGKWFSSQYQ